MESQKDLALTLYFARCISRKLHLMEGPNERIRSRNMEEPNVCYPIMTYAFHSFLVVDKRMLATCAPRMRNSNLETSSAGDRGTESTNAITNGWKSQKYIFNLAHIFYCNSYICILLERRQRKSLLWSTWKCERNYHNILRNLALKFSFPDRVFHSKPITS